MGPWGSQKAALRRGHSEILQCQKGLEVLVQIFSLFSLRQAGEPSIGSTFVLEGGGRLLISILLLHCFIWMFIY